MSCDIFQFNLNFWLEILLLTLIKEYLIIARYS